MRNLYRFIVRNHVVILFILLEILSFVFIFNFNNYQKVRFLNTSSTVTGIIYAQYSKVTDYFNLPSVNRRLAEENARLRELTGIPKSVRFIPENIRTEQKNQEQVYAYISAKIIGNTVNKLQNYLILDKGSNAGIKPDMGIICSEGVAGVITNVTPHFSTGLSLLNVRWSISAKLAKNNYFGTLNWDGKDYRRASLNDIPFHVNVVRGDTVVTSGYSTLFPEGILLGIVEKVEKDGGANFYRIDVMLSVDFKALTFVEVVENNRKRELDAILKQNSNSESLY